MRKWLVQAAVEVLVMQSEAKVHYDEAARGKCSLARKALLDLMDEKEFQKYMKVTRKYVDNRKVPQL